MKISPALSSSIWENIVKTDFTDNVVRLENNIKIDFIDTVVKVENNIKPYFIETVVEGVEWINFAHNRVPQCVLLKALQTAWNVLIREGTISFSWLFSMDQVKSARIICDLTDS